MGVPEARAESAVAMQLCKHRTQGTLQESRRPRTPGCCELGNANSSENQGRVRPLQEEISMSQSVKLM